MTKYELTYDYNPGKENDNHFRKVTEIFIAKHYASAKIKVKKLLPKEGQISDINFVEIEEN